MGEESRSEGSSQFCTRVMGFGYAIKLGSIGAGRGSRGKMASQTTSMNSLQDNLCFAHMFSSSLRKSFWHLEEKRSQGWEENWTDLPCMVRP